MAIKIIRVLFLVSCVLMGCLWGGYIAEELNSARIEAGLEVNSVANVTIIGGIIGFATAAALLALLMFVTQEMFDKMFPAIIAIVLAMLIGYAISKYIRLFWEPENAIIHVFMTTSLVLLFGFAGISLGLTRASSLESLVSAIGRTNMGQGVPKVIDTSVIIDGRIHDICKCGFLDGVFIIPRFVLKELQNIADSSDMLRRARGRRGLDILKNLQELEGKVDVRVIEDDPPETREVDGKLVRIAQKYKASIVTNDFNLNKVAQIEGVDVLNVNDLANALKPAVLPDEAMEVKVIKEGKETFQGVGYLDDGTMVVVDGGREYVGRSVNVIVTSVLQTAAGRMIFSRLQSVVS